MESDLRVGKESVDTETGSETQGHVGQGAHQEGSDQGDGRGTGDIVSLELVEAEVVGDVGHADGIVDQVGGFAHAGTTRVALRTKR